MYQEYSKKAARDYLLDLHGPDWQDMVTAADLFDDIHEHACEVFADTFDGAPDEGDVIIEDLFDLCNEIALELYAEVG